MLTSPDENGAILPASLHATDARGYAPPLSRRTDSSPEAWCKDKGSKVDNMIVSPVKSRDIV